MVNILSGIFNQINYCKNICITRRKFIVLLSVYKIFVCTLFTLSSFVISELNTTVFESDTNYTVYNDSYENLTIFNQNITDFDTNNKTPDVATELESPISVTEDSGNPFLSESSRKLFHFLTPDEDICNCDLTSNTCDINCCCDPDCDEEDMQVFSKCSHQVLTPDENYCYQKDIIFRNNTVYKMVKNPNNAMFCIAHDNFKHRLRFKDMPILKSHRDLITVLKYKYKTTYTWDTESENVFDSSELRAGNPIYIDVKSNKKIITNRWSLPSSCLSDMCSCKDDVKYLLDFQSSCSYAVGDLRNSCHENDAVLSGDHVSDFCVSPRSASSLHASGSLAELVVHTKTVGSNASEDDDAQPKRLLCVAKNPKRPRRGPRACEGVVSHVHFTVEQDGTSGITGIAADFEYADVGFEKRALTQGYSVSFVWSNVSESGRKSGNPGYQVGLPILAATNGSDVGPDDEMSRTFYEVGLGVLQRGGDGLCSPPAIRRTIKFGKNLKTGCVLRQYAAFADCKVLRNAVSDVLLGPGGRQVFVGVFGNANSSDPDDWVEVFHEGIDPPLDDGDGNCFASLGLKVDIVYAAVGTVANPQHKIVGVAYRRTKPEFVDLACFPHCRYVTLSTSVSFLDVTLPAVEHYAKVPSIKANLPSDFFYPFLYSRGYLSDAGGSACLVLVPLWCLFYFVTTRKF